MPPHRRQVEKTNQRNVRCTVEIDMYVPDVSSAPVPERFRDNPGFVAYQATQLDDESEDRVQQIIHDIIEAGDPDDAYDMTVVVSAKLVPDR